MPVERINTPRLELRDWTTDDGEAFHRFWGDPEVIWWGAAESLSDSQAFLEIVVERSQETGIGWCAVIVRETEAVVGNVALQPSPAPRTDIEIGWHFERSVWGKGYATEAATALLAHAFDVGFARVVADIANENGRSQAVARRLGLRRTGKIERSGLAHDVWVIEASAWRS